MGIVLLIGLSNLSLACTPICSSSGFISGCFSGTLGSGIEGGLKGLCLSLPCGGICAPPCCLWHLINGFHDFFEIGVFYGRTNAYTLCPVPVFNYLVGSILKHPCSFIVGLCYAISDTLWLTIQGAIEAEIMCLPCFPCGCITYPICGILGMILLCLRCETPINCCWDSCLDGIIWTLKLPPCCWPYWCPIYWILCFIPGIFLNHCGYCDPTGCWDLILGSIFAFLGTLQQYCYIPLICCPLAIIQPELMPIVMSPFISAISTCIPGLLTVLFNIISIFDPTNCCWIIYEIIYFLMNLIFILPNILSDPFACLSIPFSVLSIIRSIIGVCIHDIIHFPFSLPCCIPCTFFSNLFTHSIRACGECGIPCYSAIDGMHILPCCNFGCCLPGAILGFTTSIFSNTLFQGIKGGIRAGAI